MKSNYLDWEPSGIGRNVVYLLTSFVLYFSILFLFDGTMLRSYGKHGGRKEALLDDDGDAIEGICT